MKDIRIVELMERYAIPKRTMAKLMFPENKYPLLALNRVIEQKSELSATQLSKLAHYVDLSVDQLYSGHGWDLKRVSNEITLTNGDYEAKLNTDTWITKLYSSGSLFHESVIHSGAISLSEYLNKINSLIEINKQNEYYKF